MIEEQLSEYSKKQLKKAYETAEAKCKSLAGYMSIYNYRLLIYNYALHIAIVNSYCEFKEDDIYEPDEPLQKLYIKFGIDNTVGIVTSASSGGSSSSQQLPKSVTEGDFETRDLLRTEYGRQALKYLEAMNGVII